MHSLNDPSNRALFERYISVCNEALDNNKHRFPFRQILDGLGRQALSGNSVQVLIVDDQPAEGFCIVYEKSCRVVLAEERFNSLPQKKWKVTKSYLEGVIRNPYEYINNPAKIDWEWLHSLHSRVE
ncbi:MAG: hypothetical protein KA099_01535 [Alphaproteobacteria bacterium]|nr:hypothetical protein [Alphaproteobacteria bacterium]MBK9586165.1 hypothetical protein [Alphaproteobacteria bacterium]MBP7758654.1 hypothetical protein [Alphaproteobacteria bacterium]MBP7761682.1 hypothetical protein [Alphaproteobacteria bacterium]MBP7903983.1 hypothetical protein [Alphaproteobacteria bacterium]